MIPKQNFDENQNDASNKNVLSYMKLNLKFNNLSTFKYNSYIYNRIYVRKA